MQQMNIRPGLIDEIARWLVPVDEQGNEISVRRDDDDTCPSLHIKDVVVVLLMPHIDTAVDMLIESRKRGTLYSGGGTRCSSGCTAHWIFGRPPFLATMVEWVPNPTMRDKPNPQSIT